MAGFLLDIFFGVFFRELSIINVAFAFAFFIFFFHELKWYNINLSYLSVIYTLGFSKNCNDPTQNCCCKHLLSQILHWNCFFSSWSGATCILTFACCKIYDEHNSQLYCTSFSLTETTFAGNFLYQRIRIIL